MYNKQRCKEGEIVMEETEFDFNNILSIVGKRILLILFFLILGLGGAFFYCSSASEKFQSSTTLYAKPQMMNTGEINYNDILSSQKLVKTYSQIIKSQKIVGQVIQNLKLKMSYSEIISGLQVSSVNDTEIISIVVTTEDSALSRDIANELARVFIAEIKEMMTLDNVSIIDEATENKNPVAPSYTKMLILGGGAGLCIGLFLAFLLESMNEKIKNHEDVKKYLKLKSLGVIPNYSMDDDAVGRKKKVLQANTPTLKLLADPTSVISESFRMLRTNLNFMDLKVINVTSTLPSEGKSEVICNLAVAFSLIGKRVLVVDCDLRKPKIHRNFNLPRREGISNVILSNGTLNVGDVIQSYEVDKGKNIKVDVLGPGAKVSNPSELINSKKFETLVHELRDMYDLVLMDCPPIFMMTDGVLASKLSDGVVYVIESDRADYQVINSCIEQLQNSKAFILGTVLTKVNVKRQKKLYGHKYDYYYSNYEA